MERYKAGMLARSLAGHDEGQIYVIIESEASYIYLVNGKNRTLDRPKKKKAKHVRLIREEHDIAGINDAGIRKIIKEFVNEGKQEE